MASDESVQPAAVEMAERHNVRVISRVPGRREIAPMRFHRRRRIEDLVLAAGVPLALVALWQAAAVNEWINPQYFPAPSTIWTTALELIESGELQEALTASLSRMAWSLWWGVLTGVTAGFAMGSWRRLRVALEPLLSALYTVPKLALLPLFLLIFGPGETPIIITGGTTVFFFMWIATMAAVIAVDAGYHDAASVFGASGIARMRHVILPAVLPHVLVALRASAGIAVLVIVGTEFVQSSSGLGHLIWFSWSLFRASQMYVGIVIVGLLGFSFTLIIKIFGRVCVRWTSLDEGPRGR